jgi:hypothetical protein
LQCIDRNKTSRHEDNPKPARNSRKPQLEIDGDRGNFGSNRNNLYYAVGGANGESCPRRDIFFCVNTKRARNRVNHCHFSQRVGHHHRNQRPEQVRDDNTWSGKLDGDAASQKKGSDQSPSVVRSELGCFWDQRADVLSLEKADFAEDSLSNWINVRGAGHDHRELA